METSFGERIAKLGMTLNKSNVDALTGAVDAGYAGNEQPPVLDNGAVARLFGKCPYSTQALREPRCHGVVPCAATDFRHDPGRIRRKRGHREEASDVDRAVGPRDDLRQGNGPRLGLTLRSVGHGTKIIVRFCPTNAALLPNIRGLLQVGSQCSTSIDTIIFDTPKNNYKFEHFATFNRVEI